MLAAFITKGQDVVDEATGAEWLTEVEDEGDGTEGGAGSEGSASGEDTPDGSPSDDKGNGTRQPVDQKPEDIDKAVQTGDSQSPAGWIALILLSGEGVTGAVVYRKKIGRI